jgi:hypothetical protein
MREPKEFGRTPSEFPRNSCKLLQVRYVGSAEFLLRMRISTISTSHNHYNNLSRIHCENRVKTLNLFVGRRFRNICRGINISKVLNRKNSTKMLVTVGLRSLKYITSACKLGLYEIIFWWRHGWRSTRRRTRPTLLTIFFLSSISCGKDSLEDRPFMRLECCVGVQYSNLARDFCFYITTTICNVQYEVEILNILNRLLILNDVLFQGYVYQGSIINLCHQFICFDTTLWLSTPETLILSHIVRIPICVFT